MKKVMTVAGSDSVGGAGLQADLKTFAAMRVYGLSVVTAVTAQNTVAVNGIYPLPPEFVNKQIDAVMQDVAVDAVKTGMLANVGIIEAVCEGFRRYAVTEIVVDPVMVATSGDLLMDERLDRILWAMRNTLLPMARVVTPNIPEAEILTGREIQTVDDVKAAAVELQSLGVPNVVIKGGHLDGEEEAIDILFDGNGFFEYRDKRLLTRNTHGTGCTFAAALTAGLAQGLPIQDAVGRAKKYVRNALESGFPIGRGQGVTNHFGELYQACPETKGE